MGSDNLEGVALHEWIIGAVIAVGMLLVARSKRAKIEEEYGAQ